MAYEVAIGGSGELFVGEDKTFKFEIVDTSNIPVDMTGWTVQLDIRLKDGSADPSLLQKACAIVGVYNVVKATNTQRAQVSLSDTEMNLFRAKTYRYSLKRMDDGVETVLLYGDFAPQKATNP